MNWMFTLRGEQGELVDRFQSDLYFYKGDKLIFKGQQLEVTEVDGFTIYTKWVGKVKVIG